MESELNTTEVGEGTDKAGPLVERERSGASSQGEREEREAGCCHRLRLGQRIGLGLRETAGPGLRMKGRVRASAAGPKGKNMKRAELRERGRGGPERERGEMEKAFGPD